MKLAFYLYYCLVFAGPCWDCVIKVRTGRYRRWRNKARSCYGRLCVSLPLLALAGHRCSKSRLVRLRFWDLGAGFWKLRRTMVRSPIPHLSVTKRRWSNSRARSIAFVKSTKMSTAGASASPTSANCNSTINLWSNCKCKLSIRILVVSVLIFLDRLSRSFCTNLALVYSFDCLSCSVSRSWSILIFLDKAWEFSEFLHRGWALLSSYFSFGAASQFGFFVFIYLLDSICLLLDEISVGFRPYRLCAEVWRNLNRPVFE